MKNFNSILKKEYWGKFYAHKPLGNDAAKDKKEILENHSQNTLIYYEKIISELSLDKIIKDMLSRLVNSEDSDIFFDLFKELIYYHDIGKVSPLFQKKKMENLSIDLNLKNLDSTHSLYGMFLFDFIFLSEYIKILENKPDDEKSKYLQLVLLFSTMISRHHTALKEANSIKEKLKEEDFSGILSDLINIRQEFFEESDYFFIDSFPLLEYYDFSELINSFNEEQKESLFYLCKLIYSLMIVSDYYATMEFLQGKEFIPDLKKIDNDIKKKIMSEFYKEKEVDGKRYDFNKQLEDKNYVNQLKNTEAKNIQNINELKTKILLEADNNLRNSLEKGKKVFYLNVPTGGGKTNTSMKLALSILEKRSELNKVFYVFPFINIIEQNYKVIKNTLDLGENEISPIYSTSTWNVSSDEESYGLKYVLDNEFLNFPFVVISNVNFFNSFIKSSKSSNYRFHNLANSVVVLDEIQSLNDEDWTLFNNFIKFASENLNIYFIIMSATLPRLDEISLKLDKEGNEQYANNLLDKPERFYNHPSFKERVVFEYDKKIDGQDKIIEDLEKNTEEKSRILVVFNTIRESNNLYNKLIENKGETYYRGFEVLLLNSTLLQSRRRDIINKLERAKEEDKKIILISTQSIEAGVDVDCDYGLREMAIFDSIEQVAGRINRKNESKGHLKIFEFKNKSIKNSVYKGSFRANTILEKYKEKDIKEFLKTRNFSFTEEGYYNKVIASIKEANKSKIKEAPIDKVKFIRSLDYNSLNEEDVINQDSLSIFVGLEILNKEFTESEIKFLEVLEIDTSKEVIKGEQVWDSYKNIIGNQKQKSFPQKKIESKKLAGILNKFTFSISSFKISKIKSFLGEEIGGIYYLSPESGIYSYIEGLKDPELLDNII